MGVEGEGANCLDPISPRVPNPDGEGILTGGKYNHIVFFNGQMGNSLRIPLLCPLL